MTKLADRFDRGKPKLHYALCFKEALALVARVSEYGAAKYSAYNFMLGAPASQSVSSLQRHLNAWWSGEDVDPESGHSHLAHVAWNALRLAHEMVVRPDLDDRPHTFLTAPKEVV